MQGILVQPGETCSQIRRYLAARPRVSDTEAGISDSPHTCAARNSQWVTEIQQVFPLHKSITTRSLVGSRGVYMSAMPATALPVAALGPTGLQAVAQLAAAHS